MKVSARSDHWWNLHGVKRDWGTGWVKCSETVVAPVNSGSGCLQSHESCGVPDGASGKVGELQAESGTFNTEITAVFSVMGKSKSEAAGLSTMAQVACVCSGQYPRLCVATEHSKRGQCN